MSHLWNSSNCMSISATRTAVSTPILMQKLKMSTNVPLPSIVPDQQQQPAKSVRKQ